MLERIAYLLIGGFWAFAADSLLHEMMPPSPRDQARVLPLLWSPSFFMLLAAILPSRGALGFSVRALVVLSGLAVLVAIFPIWGIWVLGMFLQGFQGKWPAFYLSGPLVLMLGMLVAAFAGVRGAVRGPKPAAPAAPVVTPRDPVAPRLPLAQMHARFSVVWRPRRIAAVLLAGSVVWALGSLASGGALRNAWGAPSLMYVLALAGIQLAAAVGLWRNRRWAWMTVMFLQVVPPLLTLLASPIAASMPAWWWRQLPHVIVVVLLLLPDRTTNGVRPAGAA